MVDLYTSEIGHSSGFDFSVTAAPSVELVLASDITARMNHGDITVDQLGEISRQIKAVRAYCERGLNITLAAAKTITAYWQSYGRRLSLPFPPVTSVTSVTLINPSDGSETAYVSGTDFWVEGVKNKAINFNYSYSGNGIKIVYVAGITDEAEVALVKDALISEVVFWYLNRGNAGDNEYILGRTAMKKLESFKNW